LGGIFYKKAKDMQWPAPRKGGETFPAKQTPAKKTAADILSAAEIICNTPEKRKTYRGGSAIEDQTG
jgi:hypothetical protein